MLANPATIHLMLQSNKKTIGSKLCSLSSFVKWACQYTRWSGILQTLQGNLTLMSYTDQSRPFGWWCTWRGHPAGQTTAPSWRACRLWRWGRPGWRSSAPHKPCTDTANNKPLSRDLETLNQGIRQISGYFKFIPCISNNFNYFSFHESMGN